MVYNKELAKLRAIKARVHILYKKYPSLMESDTKLVVKYAVAFQCNLTESQRASVRRAGRYWRAKAHYKRQKTTTETTYITTFAKDQGVYTSYPPGPLAQLK